MSPDELLAYCLAKPGAWDDEICAAIDESYDAVVAKLPKRDLPV